MLLQGKVKGLVLGNYVVLDKLGQGGMGMVLQARHRRMDPSPRCFPPSSRILPPCNASSARSRPRPG